MTANTYECHICLHINHAIKLHCSTCGTIPAHYSVLASPSVDKGFGYPWAACGNIPVVLAKGYDRPEWHKTSRSTMRTVPADYYATTD